MTDRLRREGERRRKDQYGNVKIGYGKCFRTSFFFCDPGRERRRKWVPTHNRLHSPFARLPLRSCCYVKVGARPRGMRSAGPLSSLRETTRSAASARRICKHLRTRAERESAWCVRKWNGRRVWKEVRAVGKRRNKKREKREETGGGVKKMKEKGEKSGVAWKSKRRSFRLKHSQRGGRSFRRVDPSSDEAANQRRVANEWRPPLHFS